MKDDVARAMALDHEKQVRAMSLEDLAASSAHDTIAAKMCAAEINRRVAEAQILGARAAADSARHTRNSVIALVMTAAVAALIQFLAWRFPVDHGSAYHEPRPAPSQQ